MLCDDINYFERVQFVTTNFNNVLCSKMYQLCLVAALITPQCTLVSVPLRSKTGHLLPGHTQGICLEVCFQYIILSGNKQSIVQHLSDTWEIVVVFSRIQTLQFDALKLVAVGKFYIIETTKNILGKLTRMCRKSEIPGGLTGGGAWVVWNWLAH